MTDFCITLFLDMMSNLILLPLKTIHCYFQIICQNTVGKIYIKPVLIGSAFFVLTSSSISLNGIATSHEVTYAFPSDPVNAFLSVLSTWVYTSGFIAKTVVRILIIFTLSRQPLVYYSSYFKTNMNRSECRTILD